MADVSIDLATERWEVAGNTAGGTCVWHVATDHGFICRMNDLNYYVEERSRLIAASPMLLDALVQAVAYLESIQTGIDPLENQVIATGRAAIAQATVKEGGAR